MRIAIRAEGGTGIGMGHLLRCAAIAREAERVGNEICFFAREASVPHVAKLGHNARALPECDAVELETEAFISAAKDFGSQTAIVDSYELTEDCYKRIRKSMRSVVIDDYVRLPYTADVLINANVYANELDYSACRLKTKLLGGRYAILRSEFQNAQIASFREDARRILVTMGGTDINDYTPAVLDGLSNIRGVEITVVAGPLMKCVDAANAVAKRCKSPVSILRTPSNLAKVFASCDIAISAAGTTTYELCALGVPAILIQQADNQALISGYFLRSGDMLALGDYRDVDSDAIESAVNRLLGDPALRRVMRKGMLKLVSREGVKNIMNEAFARPD